MACTRKIDRPIKCPLSPQQRRRSGHRPRSQKGQIRTFSPRPPCRLRAQRWQTSCKAASALATGIFASGTIAPPCSGLSFTRRLAHVPAVASRREFGRRIHQPVPVGAGARTTGPQPGGCANRNDRHLHASDADRRSRLTKEGNPGGLVARGASLSAAGVAPSAAPGCPFRAPC
jgi:hypothetical protein